MQQKLVALGMKAKIHSAGKRLLQFLNPEEKMKMGEIQCRSCGETGHIVSKNTSRSGPGRLDEKYYAICIYILKMFIICIVTGPQLPTQS